MAATTVPLYSGVLQECTVEEAGSSHEVLPGLMPVFQGLSTLMAELGVDWDNWNGPAIQLPRVIVLEDLGKVAAYRSGLKEIKTLCSLVVLPQPHIAYPVLLALSELVTRAHKRQMETIVANLSHRKLLEYAEKGHRQCRIPSLKLLLRLYGPVLPISHVVKFLEDGDRSVREEAANVAFDNYGDIEDRTIQMASTILAMEPLRVEQIVSAVVADMRTSKNPENRDSLAFVLASLGLVSEGHRYLLKMNRIATLFKHRSEICQQISSRQTIGHELLQVLSGNSIPDASRNAEIASSIIRIPSPAPPKEWVALSAAAKSKGGAAVINSLTNQRLVVPDVEHAAEHKCCLTFYPTANRFKEESINSFVGSLFHAIADTDRLPTSKVLLNRYDLFHTHLILDYAQSDMVLLFHAREYPAYEKDNFPYILGYCQAGSTMPYAPIAMDFRNFVWYKGNLAALDTSIKTILGQEILFPGTELFRTVFEEELGVAAVDLFYFDSLNVTEVEKLFACKRFFSRSRLLVT